MEIDSKHWAAKYWTPENLCARCGHARNCHLDQPDLKGGRASSDRGWCTKPAGTCIFNPCDCTSFVEPETTSAPRCSCDDIGEGPCPAHPCTCPVRPCPACGG